MLQFWASREVYDIETMYSLAEARPIKRILWETSHLLVQYVALLTLAVSFFLLFSIDIW